MKYSLPILSLMLVACGHHRDVRPGTDGIHRVQVVGEDEKKSQRDAIAQANHFCDERYEKVAAIEKESTKYTGSMDEGNYRAAKTASKVLTGGGSSAWVFGGKKERNVGKVATGAGNVLDQATGEGYTTRMTFKCI